MVSGGPPSGARAVARCRTLASGRFSLMPDGLFRPYLSPAHAAALDQTALWMEEAGMAVRLDPAANLVGRREGAGPDAPALVIGSHIDSVRDAGAFDGPLGIMLGIELVARLSSRGTRLPFAVEVVAFGDEEGSRFPSAMLTSRAFAGTLPAEALDIADGQGVTLDAALRGFGLDRATFLGGARPAGSLLAYLEAHIEQGPVLEAEGLALGTVTGIAAQLRCRATVTGRAGHAGTTVMSLRQDALAGAAEMILAIERVACAAGGDVVATVGRLEVAPGAPNVIPGCATFTIDVRSGAAERRDRAAAAMRGALEAIAAERRLSLDVETIDDLPASPCDARLMDLLDRSLAACGQPVRRLVSGAGHDAMNMAALCPAAMLFIRCAGGVSHNPLETVDIADAEAALDVMEHFVKGLADALAA